MMKKITAILALALVLTGCGDREVDRPDLPSQTQTGMTVNAQQAEAKKTDVSKLSHTKIGYGSGVQTDEKNRTTGALDFNTRYSHLGAEAIKTDDAKITLTFDQGYENGYTAKILDTLKEKKVRAVFFLLKDYAEKNPDLVKRMIDEGHIIGNHSVHHYSMPTLDDNTCISEIMDMHKYVKDTFGCDMELFRPPMGEFSEASLALTGDCGYKTMMWSFAYADWDTKNQPDPAASEKKLVNAAHEGAIYLLHSVSKTNAEILGSVIDGIRAKGFEFN
ncbi:MAG: polysaccharide deacetylase family protein [Ruminococcus sp.]|nr:polysaccharide deacetylase family protein [Ruminococcus sp.]